jgi:hypothetical protein
VDPHHFNADPDPTSRFNANPDPYFQVNAILIQLLNKMLRVSDHWFSDPSPPL